MKLHFLSATKLDEDIANERLSQKDRAYYMLAGFIFSAVVGYTPLTFTNAGRAWLGLYECLLILVVTIYGFERCYTAANANNNRSFISDFICLALPVGVTTTIIAWGIYWGGWHIFQRIVLTMSFESEQAVKTMLWINNELPKVTVLLTVVLSNGIFFLRIASHLNRIKILQQSFNPSQPS